jgi:ribosome-associated translation inhibitor RaiA
VRKDTQFRRRVEQDYLVIRFVQADCEVHVVLAVDTVSRWHEIRRTEFNITLKRVSIHSESKGIGMYWASILYLLLHMMVFPASD